MLGLTIKTILALALIIWEVKNLQLRMEAVRAIEEGEELEENENKALLLSVYTIFTLRVVAVILIANL